ncbi:MAG: hypothetical protein GY853_11325 [PVC group bacterium]|nr:hypothetical protein [PVC group bacterium]
MYKQTRALNKIDDKMALAEEGSLRYSILECVKSFKSSWIELGQYLMTVHRDKTYKEWDYMTFEAYCTKEIGIRKQTAMKLLRSYYFLEQEEPEYLNKESLTAKDPQNIPSYESVNVLRQAKNNKELGIADYREIKRKVLEEGNPEREVKDVYRQMVRSIQEEVDDPETARKKRRMMHVQRMLGSLNSIKREAEMNKFLSGPVLKELEKIIEKIKVEVS